MSWTSISPMMTLPAALGGVPVTIILTHDLPVKSTACARVRTALVTVGTAVVHAPSAPLVESAETWME